MLAASSNPLGAVNGEAATKRGDRGPGYLFKLWKTVPSWLPFCQADPRPSYQPPESLTMSFSTGCFLWLLASIILPAFLPPSWANHCSTRHKGRHAPVRRKAKAHWPSPFLYHPPSPNSNALGQGDRPQRQLQADLTLETAFVIVAEEDETIFWHGFLLNSFQSTLPLPFGLKLYPQPS